MSKTENRPSWILALIIGLVLVVVALGGALFYEHNARTDEDCRVSAHNRKFTYDVIRLATKDNLDQGAVNEFVHELQKKYPLIECE